MGLCTRTAGAADDERNFLFQRPFQDKRKIALDLQRFHKAVPASEIIGTGIGRTGVHPDKVQFTGKSVFQAFRRISVAEHAAQRKVTDFLFHSALTSVNV